MILITAAFTSALFSVAAVARRQIAGIAFWHRARRDYRILCEMDDNLLQDLGLTRGDLRDATAAGYLDNPIAIVAARAAERSGQRWKAQASR
jgi:uncharacterized protein YjiS (DUF1127 family)